MSSSEMRGSHPYAANTAWSSLLCGRSSQVGRSLAAWQLDRPREDG
jgi:hypothetical protein